MNQRLGYLVRSGDPDALDSIVPMAFGNLALDLMLRKQFGRLVSIHHGFYDSVPITSVTAEKKVVDVPQVLQHRPAAPDLRLRRRAAVHHDERLKHHPFALLR